jgi:NAD(P)-dependent dehydrogenase (short-subunit alcohol dehydrogenase family)
MKLEGKVALVTGAAYGIGREIAKLFVAEGAKVVASDIVLNELDTLAQEIGDGAASSLKTIGGDVSVRAEAERMVDAAVEAFGTLDIVVNNAGIMDEFVPVGELEDDLWRKIMAVNLDGPMYICRRALQIMLPKQSGSIVNVSSVGGLFGGRAGASYTTSKHALVGLTRSIAYHYAKQGIRCNVVCPGGVATNIAVRNPNPLGMERLQTTLPMSTRTAEAIELARTVLFLASDDASFVNGEVLVADGGWTAG